MQKAKELYPKVRMYYERSEPVAEAFGDLDPKIDARLADMKEEKKADQWTGYHKIENNYIKIIKLIARLKRCRSVIKRCERVTCESRHFRYYAKINVARFS